MSKNITPMMLQYRSLKQQHPDKFLFFRLGDFYELFEEDALEAANILQITLTQRNGIPMCGIPHHQLANYSHKIISTGKKIAVAEQIETGDFEPFTDTRSLAQDVCSDNKGEVENKIKEQGNEKKGSEEQCTLPGFETGESSFKKGSKNGKKTEKKIVDRKVVNVITPGTTIDEINLSSKAKNFIFTLVEDVNEGEVLLFALDISTNEGFIQAWTIGSLGSLVSLGQDGILGEELDRFFLIYQPREVVLSPGFKKYEEALLKAHPQLVISELSPHLKERVEAKYSLTQKEISSEFNALFIDQGAWMEEYSVSRRKLLTTALFTLVSYLEFNHGQKIAHLLPPKYSRQEMILRTTTLHQLEIFHNQFDFSHRYSLIELLDHTQTAMGGRLLKEWLARPERDYNTITLRHDQVESLVRDHRLMEEVRSGLKKILDIQRITSKLGLRKILPRDLIGLKKSLIQMGGLGHLVGKLKLMSFPDEAKRLAMVDSIEATLLDEPENDLKFGGFVRPEKNKTLKEYLDTKQNVEKLLLNLEVKERESTGTSLRIKFNENVGYFFELRKSQIELPDYFQKKQSLTNVDRYVNEELMNLEQRILDARDHSNHLELTLFRQLVGELSEEISFLQECSYWVSYLDVISNLAYLALKNNYARPTMNRDGTIEIEAGRHPVVEDNLEGGEFVPNSIKIGTDDSVVHIITGPNMSGKSTFLRQTGLICILAQIGCFVPAKSANLAICDRIFTRIGSADRLAHGESTFLVEMKETADILQHATKDSLIIMDEIGRGTSTFDGLAIAWSILEYIISRNELIKTLFATHYHELMALEKHRGIENFQVQVKEVDDQILFLKKVVPGVTERSYGIHVARIAGVPESVSERADEKLTEFEQQQMELVSHHKDHDKDPHKELVSDGKSNKQEPPALKKLKQVQLKPVDQTELKKLKIMRDKIKSYQPDHMTPMEALNTLNELYELVKKVEENKGRE